MKILLDPTLAILAQDLSTEDKAELLMCILEYPNRDCNLGLWKYIKQQIDIDAQKYKEKCERAAAIRLRKSELKSSLKSDLETDAISTDKEEVVINKQNIIKNNCKSSVSSNASKPVENYVENYLISQQFSFHGIAKQNEKFNNYLKLYSPAVVERAEKTLIKKRNGQLLDMAQIVEWLEQENLFYKQNHGGL